jgi:penicillin-binding protein 2
MKIKGTRIVALVLIVTLIVALFSFRLARYQIVEGASYRADTLKTTLANIDITAPRGEILDRYGKVLASNSITYSVILEKTGFPKDSNAKKQNTIILDLVDILNNDGEKTTDKLPITMTEPYALNTGSDSDIKALRKFLKVDDNATADQMMNLLIKRYKLESYSKADARVLAGMRYMIETKGFSDTVTFTFAENVGINSITKINERSDTLPGVLVTEVPVRSYPDGTLAPHVVGMVGPIHQNQLASYLDSGYSMDDLVGQSGIEETQEKYLKGTDGIESLEIDNEGNVVNKTFQKPVQAGDNVVLTIDSDMQQMLQDQLASTIQSIAANGGGDPDKGAKANAGAAVVLNVKTGEVLGMATYPSFDLNTYNQNSAELNKDATGPLTDRAIQGTYRPGSSFKPITSIGGLEAGVITTNTVIQTHPTYIMGATTFHDDAVPGKYTVASALGVSSNYFFYTVANWLGIDKLTAAGQMFGLGTKTGIELPGEHAGTMSGKQAKLQSGQGSWYSGDTVQAGIGQSYTLATPMQLASYVATLVNSGKRIQVHVVKSIRSYDNSKDIYDTPVKVIADNKIPQNYVDVVKDGMRQVVEEGTSLSAFAGYNFKQIGGKTGTAQINVGYNAVFVAFAPFDDPEIAMAIVVEHGQWGVQSAPIAKSICNQYFGLDGNGNPLTGTVVAAKPNELIQ